MTKEDILDYVMNTPNNTNRMVLSDMLDEFNSGSGGGVFLIVEGNNYTLNKTWKEIYDAATSGLVPIIQYYDPTTKYVWTVLVENIQKFGSEYKIDAISAGSSHVYSTDSEDGYPVHEES